jgi:hypothetical protein
LHSPYELFHILPGIEAPGGAFQTIDDLPFIAQPTQGGCGHLKKAGDFGMAGKGVSGEKAVHGGAEGSRNHGSL